VGKGSQAKSGRGCRVMKGGSTLGLGTGDLNAFLR
jgi:hypothetical protein